MKKKVYKRNSGDDVNDIKNEIRGMVSKLGLDKSPTSKKIINKKGKKDNQKKINFHEKNSKKIEKHNQMKTNFHDKISIKFENRKDSSVSGIKQCSRNYLLFKPGHWDSEEFSNDPKEFKPVTKEKEQELENEAKKIMDEEVEVYKLKKVNKKGGSHDWLRTVSTKGTSGDKMAAFIYFVQESPLHNISYINSLIILLNKEKRSLESLDTMKDLFLQDLLPKNRKLRNFSQNPLGLLNELSSGNKHSRDKRLLLWYFESLLKQAYTDFINALEVFSRDTIEALRKKSIGVIWELLSEHAEQEKLLLSMLINKLGDLSSKVASYDIHLIHKLLLKHKRMNMVVALETERLLYRTNVSRRAQFYGICMLGGLKLQDDESDLACRLIEIFIGFFKLYISKGDIETKMLSAILTGVNKIFPHAKGNKEKVLEQMEALYKICHMTKFNTSIQALTLLHQVMDVSDKSSDRFYVLLYKKLLDPELPSSNKLPLFLNLLCQSMKNDVLERRVQAFTKRLLQICHSMSPPLVCSALLVLSEVSKEKPNMIKTLKTVEEEDSDDEHFVDEIDDEDLQQVNGKGDDDDEGGSVDNDRPNISGKQSSWVHRSNTNYRLSRYDPMHRNPLYCRADLECTWELITLVNHCHPTISLFAKTLLEGGVIKYSGDPLADFTFKRLLERFLSKNPKKTGDELKEKEDGSKESDKESIFDEEDVFDPVDDDKDVDFGSDFGDIFEDDDDRESLFDSDDDFSDTDELTEDEDGGIAALGIPSEKAMKQMKWEQAQERRSSGMKRKRDISKRGPKTKRHKK